MLPTSVKLSKSNEVYYTAITCGEKSERPISRVMTQ